MDFDVSVEPTFAEKEALKKIKTALIDVLTPDHTDAYLLKFLRAKNFDIQESERIFRDHLHLFLAYKQNFEKEWEDYKVMKYIFHTNLGLAKDGTPIQYLALGRGDLIGFLRSIDTIDAILFCGSCLLHDLKICKAQSIKLGREINEITFIIDADGFSLRQYFHTEVVQLGFDMLRLMQDVFPEIWKIFLVVNAPSYFYIGFNIFKPIFKRNLLSKVKIVSRDATPDLLLKYVDADVLPVSLGGNRVDSKGDPRCTEFIKYGGRIPEKYYLRNYSAIQPSDEGASEVYIGSRCYYNYSLIVQKPNSVIRTEFRTEGGSIAMSILHRKFGPDIENMDIPSKDEYIDVHDEKSNVVIISPHIHYQSHLAPVNNTCGAPYPGIYILKFENSYNLLSSRRLIYRFSVLPPNK